MSLRNIIIPLYNSSGENTEHKLVVNEFAGRMDLDVFKYEGDKSIVSISCYFEDLERAWQAVKKWT
jgi:hypothetical protein